MEKKFRRGNNFYNHAKAAMSLGNTDIIGKKRMGTQNWSLLVDEAMTSTVIPGRLLNAGMSGGGWNGGLNFPQVFGKLSSKKRGLKT